MKPILIGVTAYGNHIDTFLKYCLPSLMAEGNLPTLAKEREIIFNIHTKREDLHRLMGCTEYKWEITCDATETEKYSQLGYHQNADLQKAKKIGADYHCLMPDYVYSENFFSGMLKAIQRGHKTIARLAISTKMEEMIPLLRTSMPAKELATLGLLYIHDRIRNWLVTPSGYPKTHVLAFVGKDTLEMYSPHLQPIYIANEVICSKNEISPLDGLLDRVSQEHIYCPKPEDEMVIIELTPESIGKPNYTIVDLKEFTRIFRWDTGESAKQLAIFKEATIDQIDRMMIGDNNYWEDNEIAKVKDIVYSALKG